MTVETRQAALKELIRPNPLNEQIQRSRYERVSPVRKTSRKHIAKLRRAIGELDETQIAELREQLDA